ncbi:hypothetical protein FRB96_009353 [Tulasnella sp. 330]|nr:hypothetical protein FRB96_009353 [Tulasnella sp. 330]KAG8884429.1 hypothetical protein FRB98_002401 [Tulasnella sp. 332]KAG8885265.1 hypothetical protein FRB97_001711 [Tulasnella sp. 331]
MPARLVAANPALAPLFAAIGFAIAGSGWFAYNILKNDPHVVLNKKGEQDPWNTVRQDQNIKLYTPNRSFWTERTGLPDPRAAFLAAEHKVEDVAHKAKDKVKEIKERGVGNRP